MNRIAAVMSAALVAVVLGGAALPSHAASSSREVVKEYSLPNGVSALILEAHWSLPEIEYHFFRARPGEKRVVFSVADDTGAPVRGHVHTDKDGDGDLDYLSEFCSTSDPIRVRGGQRFVVDIFSGTCPADDLPSVVSQGTITATFTK